MITAPISSTYMAALVCISLTKRCLQCEMPNEMRLRFLEHLERMTDGVYLTSEIVAMVHPMCDDAYEIVKEAQTLGANEAIDVYARRDVFDAFVAKNPSLLKAIAAAEMQ